MMPIIRWSLLVSVVLMLVFGWRGGATLFESSIFIDADPSSGRAPLLVAFSMNEDSTPGPYCTGPGFPTTTTWDFGDNTSVQATSTAGIPLQSVQHVYDHAGGFSVTMTIQGTFEIEIESIVTAAQTEACDEVASTEVSAPIMVAVSAPLCPSAPSVGIQSVLPGLNVRPGTSILLSARATNPVGCGRLDTGWQLASKPQASGAALSSTTGLSSSFVADRVGTYGVRFGATNEFASNTALIRITVSDGVDPTPQPTPTPPAGSVFLNTPAISSINPSSGTPGIVVVLTGTNFSTILEENKVFFGKSQAQVISASPTTLTVIVPDLPDGTYPVTVSTVNAGVVDVAAGGTTQGFVIDGGNNPALDMVQADTEGSNIVLFEVDERAVKRPLSTPDVEQGFVIGEVIIFFNASLGPQALANFQSEFGFASLVEYPTLRFFRGVLQRQTVGETRATVDRLNQDSRVDRAFLNYLVDVLQNESAINTQGWLLALGLPQGFETVFPKQGEGTVIGVIDTGADLSLGQDASAELNFDAQLPTGLDFSAEAEAPPTADDELGHGTAVSTIAAATLGNDFNGAGVAPRAEILPLKIFSLIDGEAKASNEWVAQALLQAFALEVDVINMSLGCLGCSAEAEASQRDFYERVLDNLAAEQRAKNRKLPVLVAASGNDGDGQIDAPASLPDVIAVGSVKSDLSGRSDFSNYGEGLDFVAVGEDPVTTVSGGDFRSPGSGTSFSAPQVAGLAALILAESPSLSPAEVKELIKNCFTQDLGAPGFDPETGWGRVVISPERIADPACEF